MAGGRKVAMSERDLLLSGGPGKSWNSARAGFIPIGINHVPLGALRGIRVYVRVKTHNNSVEVRRATSAGHAGFRLYCKDNARFTKGHRRRLLENGVRFLYIRIVDHTRFKSQTEACLNDLAADPAIAIAEKSAIIYDTSVELVNELLAEPELLAKSPRLRQVCRAVTTLVMNNNDSFSHLLAASHHDFYTATHMVNVAAWMVPLAYELGHRDPEHLNQICQAGILHDMGKVEVPEAVLNKTGKLSDEEWRLIRRHPQAGCEYLAKFEGIDPMIVAVTGQHHERLDGSGYPSGLKGDQIHPISRICAVVDSFDAMTAFRPFKERTLSTAQALDILESETPVKYDADVMKAWLKLIRSAGDAILLDRELRVPSASVGAPGRRAGIASAATEERTTDEAADDPANRRRHERRTFHCPARAHLLVRASGGVTEMPGIPIVAHNIAQGGMGFLSQAPFNLGDFVRVYLQAPGWTARALNGQTVRCRAHTDGWHEVGLRFSTVEAGFLPGARTAA